MKNKGDGLTPPKNFRTVAYRHCCWNCRYYMYENPNISCKRSLQTKIPIDGKRMFINKIEALITTCDGWKKI